MNLLKFLVYFKISLVFSLFYINTLFFVEILYLYFVGYIDKKNIRLCGLSIKNVHF